MEDWTLRRKSEKLMTDLNRPIRGRSRGMLRTVDFAVSKKQRVQYARQVAISQYQNALQRNKRNQLHMLQGNQCRDLNGVHALDKQPLDPTERQMKSYGETDQDDHMNSLELSTNMLPKNLIPPSPSSFKEKKNSVVVATEKLVSNDSESRIGSSMPGSNKTLLRLQEKANIQIRQPRSISISYLHSKKKTSKGLNEFYVNMERRRLQDTEGTVVTQYLTAEQLKSLNMRTPTVLPTNVEPTLLANHQGKKHRPASSYFQVQKLQINSENLGIDCEHQNKVNSQEFQLINNGKRLSMPDENQDVFNHFSPMGCHETRTDTQYYILHVKPGQASAGQEMKDLASNSKNKPEDENIHLNPDLPSLLLGNLKANKTAVRPQTHKPMFLTSTRKVQGFSVENSVINHKSGHLTSVTKRIHKANPNSKQIKASNCSENRMCANAKVIDLSADIFDTLQSSNVVVDAKKQHTRVMSQRRRRKKDCGNKQGKSTNQVQPEIQVAHDMGTQPDFNVLKPVSSSSLHGFSFFDTSALREVEQLLLKNQSSNMSMTGLDLKKSFEQLQEHRRSKVIYSVKKKEIISEESQRSFGANKAAINLCSSTNIQDSKSIRNSGDADDAFKESSSKVQSNGEESPKFMQDQSLIAQSRYQRRQRKQASQFVARNHVSQSQQIDKQLRNSKGQSIKVVSRLTNKQSGKSSIELDIQMSNESSQRDLHTKRVQEEEEDDLKEQKNDQKRNHKVYEGFFAKMKNDQDRTVESHLRQELDGQTSENEADLKQVNFSNVHIRIGRDKSQKTQRQGNSSSVKDSRSQELSKQFLSQESGESRLPSNQQKVDQLQLNQREHLHVIQDLESRQDYKNRRKSSKRHRSFKVKTQSVTLSSSVEDVRELFNSKGSKIRSSLPEKQSQRSDSHSKGRSSYALSPSLRQRTLSPKVIHLQINSEFNAPIHNVVHKVRRPQSSNMVGNRGREVKERDQINEQHTSFDDTQNINNKYQIKDYVKLVNEDRQRQVVNDQNIFFSENSNRTSSPTSQFKDNQRNLVQGLSKMKYKTELTTPFSGDVSVKCVCRLGQNSVSLQSKSNQNKQFKLDDIQVLSSQTPRDLQQQVQYDVDFAQEQSKVENRQNLLVEKQALITDTLSHATIQTGDLQNQHYLKQPIANLKESPNGYLYHDDSQVLAMMTIEGSKLRHSEHCTPEKHQHSNVQMSPVSSVFINQAASIQTRQKPYHLKEFVQPKMLTQKIEIKSTHKPQILSGVSNCSQFLQQDQHNADLTLHSGQEQSKQGINVKENSQQKKTTSRVSSPKYMNIRPVTYLVREQLTKQMLNLRFKQRQNPDWLQTLDSKLDQVQQEQDHILSRWEFSNQMAMNLSLGKQFLNSNRTLESTQEEQQTYQSLKETDSNQVSSRFAFTHQQIQDQLKTFRPKSQGAFCGSKIDQLKRLFSAQRGKSIENVRNKHKRNVSANLRTTTTTESNQLHNTVSAKTNFLIKGYPSEAGTRNQINWLKTQQAQSLQVFGLRTTSQSSQNLKIRRQLNSKRLSDLQHVLSSDNQPANTHIQSAPQQFNNLPITDNYQTLVLPQECPLHKHYQHNEESQLETFSNNQVTRRPTLELSKSENYQNYLVLDIKRIANAKVEGATPKTPATITAPQNVRMMPHLSETLQLSLPFSQAAALH